MTKEKNNTDELPEEGELSSAEKTNAFHRYMKVGRGKIRKEQTSLSASQIKSLLVKNWQVLTSEEKNEWVVKIC